MGRMPAFLAAALAWLKALLREAQMTASPVDPLDPVAGESHLRRTSSHLSLFHPIARGQTDRKTLVLDLDETLVHASPEWTPCAFQFAVRLAQRRVNFYVNTRPYLQLFLRTVAQWYDVVIFTASMQDYADCVINKIDPMGVVKARYFRESCRHFQGGGDESVKHVKDMSIVRKDQNLGKVVFIDNSPVCYALNPDNAVPITTWVNNPRDSALRDLLPLLELLSSMSDVRNVLGRRMVPRHQLLGLAPLQ